MRLIRGLALAAAAAGAVGWARSAYRRNWSLNGRVAVVTGASRGLGMLLARELAEQGCRVVICARDGAELADATDALRRSGALVTPVVCDVADRAQVQDMMEHARQEHGGIDIVVNNAGIIEVGPIDTMEAEEYRRALDTMFWGPLNVTSAALPDLRARKGRIVDITSIGGRISVPHLLPYSCAKFAAAALSEGMSAALMREGVRVTTVVPGLMRTGSPWNARFKGAPLREYTWFVLSASLPPISMDAQRAARRIVRALREGRSHLTLTPAAWLAERLHSLAPGSTTRLLGLAEWALPHDSSAHAASGHSAESELRTPVVPWLAKLNADAARRFNQIDQGRSGDAIG